MNEYVPNEYLRRLKEMKAERSNDPWWMPKARAAGWVPPEEDWQREARKHGWRPRIPEHVPAWPRDPMQPPWEVTC